jgi:uncharacterized membrane protein
MSTTIRNPVEWGMDQVRHAAQSVGAAGRGVRHVQETLHSPRPLVRHIGIADLGAALREGLGDFGAYRTDVIFLCLFYPVIGLVLGKLVFGSGMLPLLFPLATGFALIGPLAAVGLYEMSRQGEQGKAVNWATPFGVTQAPSFAAIVALGITLIALFFLWLAAAELIYALTLGPAEPQSIGVFLREVLTTRAGRALIGIGVGVGFLFALLVLAIATVSFPLLLDRDVGLDTAIGTSLRVFAANPGPMAIWGLIVVGSLVIGTIPLFLGLIIVLPVLGHATWHLYRRLVVNEGGGSLLNPRQS